MNKTRPKMEEIWMQTALMLSERSKCSKAKVGCIITTKDLRHVLGNGYNGFAKNVDYICESEYCKCLHAETNAVIDCGGEFKDKIFFITMFPCLSCAIQIINSGCSKLYYKYNYKEGSRHYKDLFEILSMFKNLNIEIIQL